MFSKSVRLAYFVTSLTDCVNSLFGRHSRKPPPGYLERRDLVPLVLVLVVLFHRGQVVLAVVSSDAVHVSYGVVLVVCTSSEVLCTCV